MRFPDCFKYISKVILVLIGLSVVLAVAYFIKRPTRVVESHSPNGRMVLSIERHIKRGLPMPPEPADVLSQYSRAKIRKTGWLGGTIYASDTLPLSRFQSTWLDFHLDFAWAPDSMNVGFRHAELLRIIDMSGTVSVFGNMNSNTAVASFAWRNNGHMTVVEREVDSLTHSYYEGYLWNATKIRISDYDVVRKTRVSSFEMKLSRPTFVFASAGFGSREISPNGSMVAFFTGDGFDIYDIVLKKHLISGIKVLCVHGHSRGTGQPKPSCDRCSMVDGIWWMNNEVVVIGLELLGSPDGRVFYKLNWRNGTLLNASNELLPKWDQGIAGVRPSSLENSRWFEM